MRLHLAAADPSGAVLGAALVPAVVARVPGVEMAGLAGPRMRAVGVEAVARAEDVGGVGIVEVAAAIPRIARTLDRLDAALPGADLVVTIDAPSMLLRLGRRARRRGIPVVQWVAPQVWAWRPGRVDVVARSVDAVLCLLPFEPAWFEGRVRALFVGHPAAAIRPGSAPAVGRPRIALCPGSRRSEVEALWPVLREVARRLRRVWPDVGFVAPRAPGVELGGLDVAYVDRMADVAGCDAAVVASGTATLELAALDVPMVVVYRVHPLTAAIARRMLTIDAIALPNVLAGRRIVPEHVQDLDPDQIAADVVAWVGRRGQVPRALIASLCGATAIDAVADEVAAWLTAASPAPAGRRPAAPGS